MKRMRTILWTWAGLAMVHLAGWTKGAAAESPNLPDFQEVYGLIRSNLSGVNEAALSRSAVLGLVHQLQPRVILETNAPDASAKSVTSLISKTETFDESFAYLRLSQVAPNLEKAVAEACRPFREKKKLSGLILDLRFADGQDYAAATATADLFMTNEQPLLKLGDSIVRSTAKTNAIQYPVAILVNQQTAGAAEVLAALLRQAQAGLIIGATTAGQAHQFKEFVLTGGHRLRIAAGSIELGNGLQLTEKGLAPDIRIDVNPEDEKAYLGDPYKTIPKLLAQALRPNGNDSSAGISGTNRTPRRKINESDLVRMRQQGNDPDAETLPPHADQPAKLVVNDPALARAIDLLKGLALVQSRR